MRSAGAAQKTRDSRHVILDGTVIPADRCREKTVDVWYSARPRPWRQHPGRAGIGIHLPVKQAADGREAETRTRRVEYT